MNIRTRTGRITPPRNPLCCARACADYTRVVEKATLMNDIHLGLPEI